MNRQALIEDIENMDEVMSKTADRADIWQDRYIYWMAVAIWHILTLIIKEGDK